MFIPGTKSRQRDIDHHFEFTPASFIDQMLNHVVGAVGRDLGAEEYVAHLTITRHQRRYIDRHRFALPRRPSRFGRDKPASGSGLR